MMVVGMTFLGTTTSFGRNNNNGRQDMERNGRNEMKMDNRRQEMRCEDDRRTYRMQPPVEHRQEMHRHNTSDVVTGVVTGVVVGTVINGILNTITR
jgi:F0F1-type ATP synthase assembly protein I